MPGVVIHSRTEALTIVDDEAISRRITLDFKPKSAVGEAHVRLRGLRCGSIRKLELRESGRALPVDVEENDFLAVVPAAPQERRVLEVSYEEELTTSRKPLLSWFGVAPSVMAIALPEEQAEWLHFELDMPDGVNIVGSNSGRTIGQRRLQGTVLRSGDQTRIPSRMLTVYLRADRHGFLASALLLGLVTAALAVTGAAYLRDHASGDAGSLALIVPALLAAFLVRPAEHALAGALLESTRWALTLSGVANVAAAVLLVGDVEGKWGWIGLAGVACLALLVPVATWLSRSKAPRGEDRIRFGSARIA